MADTARRKPRPDEKQIPHRLSRVQDETHSHQRHARQASRKARRRQAAALPAGPSVDAWCEREGATGGQHRIKGPIPQSGMSASEPNQRAYYFCEFKNFVTSRAVGMEGCA